MRLGEMPEELERLADAMDDMASRLRNLVGAVVKESQQLAGSAGDFSAMSEEIAASSCEYLGGNAQDLGRRRASGPGHDRS